MMFWNFVGSLFYESCDFVGTSIIFFLLNIILLVLIGGFNFLDIDKKSHKYTFFQILYITLVYFFFWISVSASALLSQQVYINSFQIMKKNFTKNKYEKNNKRKLKNRIHLYNTNYNNTNNNSNGNPKKNNDGHNNLENLLVIYITNFLAFFINYPINRAITKYRKKYISKKLKNIYIKRENAYIKIYSKDRKLFLFTVFIPYCVELIISLIIYGIFNSIIFTKSENIPNENINKVNSQMENGKNMEIKIKEVSFKRLLGYTILNQTIIEKDEKQTFCDNCFECFRLLIISVGECLKNSFCFIWKTFYPRATSCYKCDCCECECSLCKCCRDCCSCYYIETDLEQKEMKVCFCYQEKRKLKWFKNFINNKKQVFLVQLVFLIAYFRAFSIGTEVLYKEKNENNIDQENIMLPLTVSFLCFTFFPITFVICSSRFDKNNILISFKSKLQNINVGLSIPILLGCIVALTFNGAYSFFTSILYFTNRKFFDKDKDMHVSVYINKFAIFVLTYFCQTPDEENELISNSSLIAVYLYIIELIASLTKKIFSVRVLIIFQIVFSVPIVILYFFLLLHRSCFN